MNNTILEKVLDLSSHSSNPNPGDANSAKIEGNGCVENCDDRINESETSSPHPHQAYAYIPISIYYIEGVGILCVGTIGIIINLLATRLLLRTKRRHTFHNLLLTLTIYDLLQIIFSIICFALPQLSLSYRNNIFIYVIPFMIPLAQITLSGSSFTTVTLTIERYISLCAPYLRYTHGIRSLHYIIPVLIFSTLYNSPRFFEWRTHSEIAIMPCVRHFGISEIGITEPSFIPNDMINLNQSGEIENFPTINEVWQYYEESPFDENAKSKISDGHSISSSQIQDKFEKVNLFDGIPVHLNNDTEEKLRQYERTLTMPPNISPEGYDYQMDWKEEQEYLTSHENISFDPNCTEKKWNVTLVPSSLRKNPIYLTLYINWMNFFINLLLPLLIMFVLNLGIYRVLKNLWAAHRTCCMNHRNRENLITSLNQRGRRASMGVQRFCRRVSRNSTTEEEPTRIENILVNDVTTPKRSFTSRLHSPENIGMTVLRMESTETLETPTQGNSSLRISVEEHENPSITVTATCSDRDHEERERDVRYTRVSILMVVLYFVCHAPRIITNTVEMAVASDKIPIWFELLVCINHLLVVSNSSFNFLIYLWASKRNSDQSNNILACPSLISWLRSLYGRLHVPQFRRHRPEQQNKHKLNSHANGENFNGDCMHESRITPDLMVPMIITSSPTSPHIFENHKKLDEDTDANTT